MIQWLWYGNCNLLSCYCLTFLFVSLFLVKGLINQQFRKRKKTAPLLCPSCLVTQFAFPLPSCRTLASCSYSGFHPLAPLTHIKRTRKLFPRLKGLWLYLPMRINCFGAVLVELVFFVYFFNISFPFVSVSLCLKSAKCLFRNALLQVTIP